MSSPSARLFVVSIAGLLLLASCSSGDDSTSSTTASTTAASVLVEEPDDTTTTVDNRTEEERIIDELDLMMFDLGVTDLEGTADCVLERLESEGMEVEGGGPTELVALFGCDDTTLARWLPPANPALAPETWTRTIESLGDWINDLTIVDAEAFLGAAEPPTEFFEETATRCDVTVDEIAAAF